MARKLRVNGPFLRIEPIPIERVDEVADDLLHYANEMEVEQHISKLPGDSLPLQNRGGCMGVWGNRPCDYLPLCEGRMKDMPRMPLLQGYPPEFIKEVRGG